MSGVRADRVGSIVGLWGRGVNREIAMREEGRTVELRSIPHPSQRREGWGTRICGCALVLDVAVHLHADDATVGVEDDGSGEGRMFAPAEEGGVVEEAEVGEGDGGEAFVVGAGVGDKGELDQSR